MRRRQSIAALFVFVMLALGGAIVLRWHAQQPKHADIDIPMMIDWHPASAKQFNAAKSTVNGQLVAFRADNFQRASHYQSEMLRLNFYSVGNFRAVITNRYPEFCNFASVVFGRCSADPTGGLIRLEIMLLSKDGKRTRAAYLLRQENGEYRVAGVQPGEQDSRQLGHHDGPFPGGHFPGGPGHFPGAPGRFPGGHFPGGSPIFPGGPYRVGNADEPFRSPPPPDSAPDPHPLGPR